MKIWQKISIALIALALCVGLLSFSQISGRWMPLDAPQVESWGSHLNAYVVVGGSNPLFPLPNVSWNNRVVWFFGGPQPNVSWNGRIAWIFTGPQPNVSWNS